MAFYRWLCENKQPTIEAIDKISIEEYKQYLFSLPASKYSKYKDRESLSSGTINQKLVAVKSFLKYINYVYEIWLDANKIKMNKVRYQRCDFFEENEIQEIVKAVDTVEKFEINKKRLKLLIMIAYTSWLRLNEIRNLTIEQVMQWKAKITWKGDKDRRAYFTENTQKLLCEYIELRKQPIERTWKIGGDSFEFALIGHNQETFWNKIGKQAICEAFKKLNDFLGRSKHITCHTLRHSFATKLVNSGVNLTSIQNLMGHSKLSTTAIYIHENWSNLKNIQDDTFKNFAI